MNLLTGGIGSGLGAPIGVNVRFTLVIGAASFDVGAGLAAGLGAATGLGPVILDLDGAGLVLELCTGSVSTSPFFAASVVAAAAACFEASAALAALIAVSLAA